MGWEVTVVTAPLGTRANERLGFPRRFTERARVVEAGSSADVLQPLRRTLWLFGLRRKESLLEQLKAQLPAARTRMAFDRFFHVVLALIAWPDLQAPWRSEAVRAADALLNTDEFDAILSSSPFPTSHVVAATLKRRHSKVRWIADFRDLWADNHDFPGPAWRRWINRRWEARLLRSADAIIAPTDDWAEHLHRLHGKPTACVPNGFVDYEQEPDAPDTPPADKFLILYSGVRYPKHQSIRPLLEALGKLRASGIINATNFQFRWIGPFDGETSVLARELRVADLVSQEAPLGRLEAKAAQRASHMLLFLQWQDPATDWSSSLKLHEYVGSGRHILALGGFAESNVSRLLLATHRARLAFDTDQVATALAETISDVRRGSTLSPPSDWRVGAMALSGISRGLPRLDALLRGRTP
jgi:hypothetical protein